MVKVSILMPACNVEKFIRECMDSVVNQTLRDIEIICLDDGSKDSTGDILDEYAENDSRIKVIHKPNSGYGHSMNVGLEQASGEYIGIIETDDFADLNMFEELYETAKRCDADVVKSNYYTYVSKPEPKSEYFEVLKPYDLYNKVFRPSDEENQEIFRVRPCIWSGIYRRQMLLDYNIRFTETPGASYQDTSFAFKIWACAERACLVKNAYLHYRTDNANSSVKSSAKVFCLCDEYASTEKFLDEHPEKKEKLEKLKNSLKYESYRWNLQRLTMEFKYAFLVQMHKEFMQERKKGLLDKKYFTDWAWLNLNQILDNMDGYYKEKCRQDFLEYSSVEDMAAAIKEKNKKIKNLEKKMGQLKKSKSFKIGRAATYIPRKIRDVLK